MKKNILFLGSKPIGYRCLNFLIEHRDSLDINIVGVLSNENSRFSKKLSIRQLCLENSITFIEELDEIKSLQVDFLLSVQYHLILKQEHIDIANILAVNLHMAPLPEYRGCNQFSFAIYHGDQSFGTTLHQIDTGIDSGPILFERRFEIESSWMVKDLYDETVEQSYELFITHIGDIFTQNYSRTDQSKLIPDRGTSTIYRKDIKKLKTINLAEGEKEIIAKVRATAMPGFEPPYTIIDSEKYYIVPERLYKRLSQ